MTAYYELKLSQEELEIVRLALCDASIKALCHAHKVQRECEERGLENTIGHIYMSRRDKIRAIIARIDED